jgi:tetratricopeptide (TPR) repeat protein
MKTLISMIFDTYLYFDTYIYETIQPTVKRLIREVKAFQNIILLGLLASLFALAPTMLFGQIPGTLTSEELNVQRLFIEANREKLLGSYEDAANLYNEVLEHDPRNDAAAYELSRVYESLERYNEALDQINKAIRLNSDNTWYHLMKADILEMMENYPAAIEVFEHLTTVTPQENYYFLHLVDLLLKTNQPERALVILDDFENNAGILPEIINYKVDVLDELNRPADAVVELEKLVRLYPRNIEYLHLLAAYCLKAGNKSRADWCYQQILDIDEDDPRANLAVADQYKAEGEDASYLKSIKLIMENPAIDLDAKIAELIPFVEKYTESQDPEYGKALGNLIFDLVQQYDDEAKTHALYGDFLYQSGKLIEAETEYKKTLVLNKSVLQVWEQLMYIQAELKNMDGLLRTANSALDVFPNQGSIYYMMGLAYAYKEDYNQAVSELQQALIMSGRDEELKYNVTSLLAKVYMRLGDEARANEAFEKVIGMKPNNTDILYTYSRYLVQQGNSLNKAEQYAVKVLEARPANHEVEHLLAFINYQKNNLENALKYMNLAMDHGAGDIFQSLELYGDILFSSGKIDEGVEYWQLSLNAGNTSEVLKRKITERKLVH